MPDLRESGPGGELEFRGVSGSFGDTKLNSFANGVDPVTAWELSIMSPKLPVNSPKAPKSWY